MLVHLSDLANPSRPFPLALKWAERVVTEFMEQGDQEEAAGLPVSAMCDRKLMCMPKAQLGFVGFFMKVGAAALCSAVHSRCWAVAVRCTAAAGLLQCGAQLLLGCCSAVCAPVFHCQCPAPAACHTAVITGPHYVAARSPRPHCTSHTQRCCPLCSVALPLAQPTLEGFAVAAPAFVEMAKPSLEDTTAKWAFLQEAGVMQPQASYPPFPPQLSALPTQVVLGFMADTQQQHQQMLQPAGGAQAAVGKQLQEAQPAADAQAAAGKQPQEPQRAGAEVAAQAGKQEQPHCCSCQ